MRSPRSALPVALVGAVVWVALFAAARKPVGPLGWIELMLALAPLVIVPLGLALIVDPSVEGHEGASAPAGSLALGLARRLQPMLGALAVASLLLPVQSSAAIACAAAWAVVPSLAAVAGLLRIAARRSRAQREPGAFAVDAALLYLPVGAAWFIAARAGWRVLGFDETLALLTATHFHYAAFASPLIAGLSLRALAESPQGSQSPAARALRVTAVCVIAGMALTAGGITATKLGASRVYELVAAVGTSAAMTAMAALGLFAVLRCVRPAPARAALTVSFASLFASMFLSVLYAQGAYRGHSALDIAQMARWHGSTNALGFALAGLLGFTLAARSTGAQGREGDAPHDDAPREES